MLTNDLFQEELLKMLSIDDEKTIDNDNKEEKTCLISGEPLTTDSVKLECGHEFNYDSLLYELYQQKFIFKTYGSNKLYKDEYEMYNKFHKDNNNQHLNDKYFIKCPYCRNIQFQVLPYKEPYAKYYGLNTIDKTYALPKNIYSDNIYFIPMNYSVVKYRNILFTHGNCADCHWRNLVGETPLSKIKYCTIHFYEHYKVEKKIEKDQKIKDKEQKKLEKEQKKLEKEQKIKDKEQKIKDKEQKKLEKEQKIKDKEQKNKEKEQKKLEKEQKNKEKEQKKLEKEQKIKDKEQKKLEKEQKIKDKEQKKLEKEQKIKDKEQKKLEKEQKNKEKEQKNKEKEQNIKDKEQKKLEKEQKNKEKEQKN